MLKRNLSILLLLSVLLTTPLCIECQNAVKDLIAQGQFAEQNYLYQQALNCFRKALELDPQNPELHLAAARQLIGLEQLDSARDELHTAITLNPSLSEAHTMLAIYYQKFANDFASAETHYRRAIQGDPMSVRPRNLLGELYVSLQRLDDARAVYEELCRVAPDDFYGHFGLGNVLIKQAKADMAVSELQRAIALKPTEPDPYRLLGQALAQTGNRDAAMQALEQYKKLKELDNQLTNLLRSVRRSPQDASKWIALGGFYFKNRDTRKAIEAFERGLSLDPQRAPIYGYLGILYLQEKNTRNARLVLEKAVELDPNNAESFNTLGVCYMLENDHEKAAQAFQRCIDLGNKDPRVAQNLQSALAKQTESQKQ